MRLSDTHIQMKTTFIYANIQFMWLTVLFSSCMNGFGFQNPIR